MASIRARSDSGLLLFDFRYQGIRCREQTTLEDTKPNRTRMEKILSKIEEDIASGSFVYSRYFPESKIASKFGEAHMSKKTVVQQIQTMHSSQPLEVNTPIFKLFCEQWFAELSIGWRRTYVSTVRQILDTRLIPVFADRQVSSVSAR